MNETNKITHLIRRVRKKERKISKIWILFYNFWKPFDADFFFNTSIVKCGRLQEGLRTFAIFQFVFRDANEWNFKMFWLSVFNH